MGPLLNATAAMTAPPVNIPAVKMNSVFISTNSFLPHGFRENSKINAIFARSNTGRMTQNAKQYLLAAAVVLIAINLSAPITSVAHVLPEITLSLDLLTVQPGLLTTIPVLAFGLFPRVVSWLLRL